MRRDQKKRGVVGLIRVFQMLMPKSGSWFSCSMASFSIDDLESVIIVSLLPCSSSSALTYSRAMQMASISAW